MKKIIKIAKVELNVLFFSPIAWLVLAIFMLQCGMSYLDDLARIKKSMINGYQPNFSLTTMFFGGDYGLFTVVQQYLYLYMPILTMGLMSRETSSGSIKLLLSSPVKLREIILGKYIAIIFYGLLMIAVLLIYAVIGMSSIQHVEAGVLFSGLLGLYLLICTYAAIGLFMSCLTIYQVVAAISTLAIFAALRYVSGLWQQYDLIRDLTWFLSISGRTEKMIAGLITTRDIFYYLIIITTFLILCVLLMKGQREMRSGTVKAARYSLLLCCALLLGYLTSRPALTGYLDTTNDKVLTLAPNSQKIAKTINGPLVATTYVNMFAPGSYQFMPQSRNFDLATMEMYKRFIPGLEVRYVYYYEKLLDTNFAAYRWNPRLKNIKNIDVLAQKMAENQELDLSMFMKPAQINKAIDLSPVGYKNVRKLDYNGKTTFLRFFARDQDPNPGEPEWMAALKRLTQPTPHITFIVGNNERDVVNHKGRGYYSLFTDPDMRKALISQGFDIDTVDLNKEELPANTDIAVLADPTEPFNPDEQEKLSAYLSKGGNMFITSQAGRSQVINPLLKQLGLSLKPGVLVNPDKNISNNIIMANFSRQDTGLDHYLDLLMDNNAPLKLKNAAALVWSDTGVYKIKPAVLSPRTGWNKAGTLDLDAAAISCDTAAGDEKGQFPVIASLTRQIGDRQQRIIVSGESDAIGNDLLGANFPPVTRLYAYGLFRWFTNSEYPVDASREGAKDTNITMSKETIALLTYLCKFIIPALIGLGGVIVLFRRKRK